MKEFSIMFGVLVLWIVLNRWILPWFGIHTCMSGGCATNVALRAAANRVQDVRSDKERSPNRLGNGREK